MARLPNRRIWTPPVHAARKQNDQSRDDDRLRSYIRPVSGARTHLAIMDMRAPGANRGTAVLTIESAYAVADGAVYAPSRAHAAQTMREFIGDGDRRFVVTLAPRALAAAPGEMPVSPRYAGSRRSERTRLCRRRLLPPMHSLFSRAPNGSRSPSVRVRRSADRRPEPDTAFSGEPPLVGESWLVLFSLSTRESYSQPPSAGGR